MTARRAWLQAGAIAWAVVGFGVASVFVAGAGPGTPILVWVATVAFPACAVLAAVALGAGHTRHAGALLVLSAATPTFFAWPLNVPALLAGLALLCWPARMATVQPLQ